MSLVPCSSCVKPQNVVAFFLPTLITITRAVPFSIRSCWHPETLHRLPELLALAVLDYVSDRQVSSQVWLSSIHNHRTSRSASQTDHRLYYDPSLSFGYQLYKHLNHKTDIYTTSQLSFTHPHQSPPTPLAGARCCKIMSRAVIANGDPRRVAGSSTLLPDRA